jgi:hypothetical protein
MPFDSPRQIEARSGYLIRRCRIKWRRPGSDRQPPACKAGALPVELRPRNPPGFTIYDLLFTNAYYAGEVYNHKRQIINPKWAREDSNFRPHAYQACALTN